MPWQYTPYILPLLAAATISAVLAIYAWRRRSTSGAIIFALLMLAVAEWTLGYTLELVATDLSAKIFWAKVEYLGIVTVPPVWLAFSLQFTNRLYWLTRRNLVLLAIVPFLTLLLVWTNELHALMWSRTKLNTIGPLLILDVNYGSWFWIYLVFSYVCLLLGTALLLQMLIRSPHLYRLQTSILLLGVLAPWIANGLHLAGQSLLDLTPFAFTISGTVFGWAFFRFRLLNVVPIVRQAIVDAMPDGVIVLDAQNRIVDLNPAAQRLLGYNVTEAIGKSSTQILSSWSDLLGQYRNVTEGKIEVVLDDTGESPRHFEMSISPLHPHQNLLRGKLIVLRDITERKQAEVALLEEHNILRTLIDNVPDFIYVKDTESRFIIGNVAVARLMGAKNPEELVGKTDSDFFPEELATKYRADEMEIIDSGQPLFDHVEPSIDPAGNQTWLLTTKVPLQDSQGQAVGIVGIGRDITERKQAEQALVKLATELEIVLQLSIATATILDTDELLQEVVDLTKYSFGLYHAHIYLLDESEKTLVLRAGAGIVGRQMVNEEWSIPLEQEQSLVARVARTGQGVIVNNVREAPDWLPNPLLPDTHAELAVPLIVGERVLGVLDVQANEVDYFTDNDVRIQTTLTAQVAVALENAHLYEQALEASRLKTQLLANVSHDLRTPLNAILGYTEMLQEGIYGSLSDQQRDVTREIIDSTGQLLNFVNNLLNQAQIEAGKLTLNITSFAPMRLIDDVKSMLGVLARSKNLALTGDVAPGVPAHLLGDSYWLRQIMVNLVSNAIKFTEQGSVHMSIFQADANHWALQVSDTGPGIPVEAQTYIFDAFRQVDGTVTRGHGGSGLGLSIVKELTTLMGGQITLNSEAGQGSTFTVLLPFQPIEETAE